MLKPAISSGSRGLYIINDDESLKAASKVVFNIPKLMEINPRFWGSLALPIFAGVDFPFIMYCLARRENIKPINNYRVGVRARWLFMGDFLWLFTSKKFSKDLKQFLHFKDDLMTYDIFSKCDPLPAAGAIIESIISFINPERRKHALNRGEKLNNINE